LGNATNEKGVASSEGLLVEVYANSSLSHLKTVLALSSFGGDGAVFEVHNCSSAECANVVVDPLDLGHLSDVSEEALHVSLFDIERSLGQVDNGGQIGRIGLGNLGFLLILSLLDIGTFALELILVFSLLLAFLFLFYFESLSSTL